MGKLITPTSFADRLAGLREVLPLTLADEVKGEVCLPVVGSGADGEGKLLRASPLSNTTVLIPVGHTVLISHTGSLTVASPNLAITCTTVFLYLMMKADLVAGAATTQWTDSSYTASYKTMTDGVWYPFNIFQNVLYFRLLGAGIDESLVTINCLSR